MQKKSNWIQYAINVIESDFNRSSDTHLIRLKLPFTDKIDVYFKDESTHPTGSLKHRLARSLFLYAICNGWITENTKVYETSSGNTAVSEAYFAQLLNLQFFAVIPETTSQQKVEKIQFYNGKCIFVKDPCEIYSEAIRLSKDNNGHYLDQFTFAERATDWRGNNNIAESIYRQLSKEKNPTPKWIVMSAGTGGTSATLGRYIRYTKQNTNLCVVDPENSVFFDYYKNRDSDLTILQPSKIEGIGRPRVEPSFIPQIIDRMIKIPDTYSIASCHLLSQILGIKCGASSGTNFLGVLILVHEMLNHGESGSIVSLICDSGDRYLDSYFNKGWLSKNHPTFQTVFNSLNELFQHGKSTDILQHCQCVDG